MFLTKENSIKIGDFGVSHLKDIDDSTESKQTLVGTIKYMSPEIRENRKYSYNTDIWSAGCVLYELITLETYYDFIQNNKISLIDYELPIFENRGNDLNKLLKIYSFHF